MEYKFNPFTGKFDLVETDHTLLSNIGTNAHSAIDTAITASTNHIADNTQAHTDYMLNTGDTASGNYTFDTNTLFIDATNNRIGIGTASPLRKLHIRDSSGVAELVVQGLQNASVGNSAELSLNTAFTSDIDAADQIGRQVILRSYAVGAWGTSPRFDIMTSDTTTVAPTTKFTILAGGKVGIGTATPANELHVAKNSNANTTIRVSNTTSNVLARAYFEAESAGILGEFGSYSAAYTGGGGYEFMATKSGMTALFPTTALFLRAADENGPIEFYAGGATTAQMYLKSDGKFGIGTITPESKLNIYNNVAWQLSSLATSISSNTAFRIRGRNTAVATIVMGSMNTLDYAIQGVNDAGTAGTDIAINPWGGNVGIGDATPSYKLDVNGTIRAVLNLYANQDLIVGGDVVASGEDGFTADYGTYSVKLATDDLLGPRIESSTGFGIGTTAGSGFYMYSDLTLRFDNVPTSDPGIKGKIWKDGTDLKISI